MANKHIDTVTHSNTHTLIAPHLMQSRTGVGRNRYPSLGIKGCSVHEKSGEERGYSILLYLVSRAQHSEGRQIVFWFVSLCILVPVIADQDHADDER